MSLPLPVVDRLFQRLSATYGRDFIGRWDGLDIAAVKTTWAHELSGFGENLPALAWGLEHLPERAPNVIEFRNLCRKAPDAPVKFLPAPEVDPVFVRKTIASIKPPTPSDQKAWARRILSRHEAGEKVLPISLRFAREALRIRQVEETHA